MAFLRGQEGWLRADPGGDARAALRPVGWVGDPGRGARAAADPRHRARRAGRRRPAAGARAIRPRRATGGGLAEGAGARPAGAGLDPLCRRWSGAGYATLALRDTRSRWGSCSPDGRLMYSWRLIMAPPAVLDYVAAHEVAHLVEMNHSPAFWAVVSRIYPGLAGPARLAATSTVSPAPRCAFRIDPCGRGCFPCAPCSTPPPARSQRRAPMNGFTGRLRQQVMHGEMDPGQPLTLRGLGQDVRRVDDPGARGGAAAGGRGGADLVLLGPDFDAGTDPGADRGAGGDPRAAGAGDGRPRPAPRPFRADRAAGGDQPAERRGGGEAGCGGLCPHQPGVSPHALSARPDPGDAGDVRDGLAATGADDAGALCEGASGGSLRSTTG